MRSWKRATAVAAAACAALVALVAPGVAHAQSGQRAEVPLRVAVAVLPVADERREGYDRGLFRHWIDADRDGCSTRAEVLLEEAVQAPEVVDRCTLIGGSWYSYYDDVTVTEARALDIDHMVPLAESWDSGAWNWTPERRRAYANDLDEPVALVAVTARSNRSKADQDPTTWLPPHRPAVCRYLVAWVTVKIRWTLAVDPAEHDVLTELAAGCPDEPISVEPA
ncbi:HNH endonuclease family protein [Saccharothrix syringae]|uniref:HNH endonuclease n=1 Tax=Saccharothrix syringae TaxID=103733 RepID=A0A5Q0H2V0_SACSY|nr:HNH endonuclease family protein [Saccharothrix syringae]QFZ20449.1 HNH endonuclease [Saccharothrix syringae]